MDKKFQQIPSAATRPSEFMRARRPELFSDSTAYDEAIYPRSVFDHFLDTLTSRNEERSFEVFARRLAEREVCPNLVPQTGPVGGGDSKVDSETYPVAEEIAATWYHNSAVSAAREKWAFAISAKRDWRSKVQSDVRKIAGTGRGYTNIFFITSQYVPDKARGELQDALSRECCAKVTIFDRGWILERTYSHHHLDLAFEVFSLAPQVQRVARQGPSDAAREAELAVLDQRIADVTNYGGSKYRRAEDALEAALLSRALGRNNLEVDGRFSRAIEILDSPNGGALVLRFRYLQAWTRFWWFDDAEGTERLYGTIFSEVKKGNNAWEAERALNLWFCLYSAVKAGSLPPGLARLDARAKELDEVLLNIQQSDATSTNSLFAQSQRVFLRLALRIPCGTIEDLLTELHDVMARAVDHIDFPMDLTSRLLHELGALLDDSTALDLVLDKVLSVTELRTSNEAAAATLVERAERKLRSDKPYDAISLLGRALVRLKNTEARREMTITLALLAAAYERVGLLWAARGMLMLALERGLRPLREGAVLPPLCVSLARRLVWVEMQLGRPTSIFRTICLTNLYRAVLGKTPELNEREREEEIMLDAIFSILVLRTPKEQLARLPTLPGILGHPQLNLPVAQTVALYALGYEDAAAFESGIAKEKLHDFFGNLSEQPAADDLPNMPIWHLGRRVTYRTCIVGCEIQLEIDTNRASILFAESLLAAVEASGATAMHAGLFPAKSVLRCYMRQVDNRVQPLTFDVVENEFGDTVLNIRFDPHLYASRENLVACGDAYNELVFAIVFNSIMPPNEAAIEQLLGDGEAFTRISLLPGLPIIDSNVLGDEEEIRLDDWAAKLEVKESFLMLRSNAWDHGRPKRVASPPIVTGSVEQQKLSGQDGLKHTQMVVGDIINVGLWDRAKWCGTLAQVERNGELVIGLIFEDIDAGRKIFHGLRNRLGPADTENRLQVIVLTGIDAKSPQAYRIVLTPNWEVLYAGSKRSAGFLVTRSNTMNPKNSIVIDLIKSLQTAGRPYRLAPCTINAGQPLVFADEGLQKRSVSIVPAWTIDESSPLLMGLQSDDDVLIPPDATDAPVLAALARLRSFGR